MKLNGGEGLRECRDLGGNVREKKKKRDKLESRGGTRSRLWADEERKNTLSERLFRGGTEPS